MLPLTAAEELALVEADALVLVEPALVDPLPEADELPLTAADEVEPDEVAEAPPAAPWHAHLVGVVPFIQSQWGHVWRHLPQGALRSKQVRLESQHAFAEPPWRQLSFAVAQSGGVQTVLSPLTVPEHARHAV